MQDIPQLDAKGLRRFGLTMGAMIALLFGAVLPYLFSRRFPVWPWLVAAPFWLLGALAPGLLESVYKGWMRFATVLGAVNTKLILTLFFYLIIMPTGLVMRLFGRDSMRRKPSTGPSYRVPSRNNPPKHMEKPF